MSDTVQASTQWPPCCDICGKPLDEPGALLFSPPDQYSACVKNHVCKTCYVGFAGVILRARLERSRA